MRMIRPSNEAEMIAEFLRQEWGSQARYGEKLAACLREEDADPTLIIDVDLVDEHANARRKALLRRYRGYGSGQPSYLTDFPTEHVRWYWAALSPTELLAARHIRYEYWPELAGGTRSPVDAARRIRAGHTAFNISNDGFLAIVELLRTGWQPPPLILVRAAETDAPVILEGHSRLTAYALAPQAIPSSLQVLIGESPAIARWDEY